MAAMLAGVTVLLSCSIKEDRCLCPSVLTVSISNMPEGVSPAKVAAISIDSLQVEEIAESKAEFRVNGGYVNLFSAVGGEIDESGQAVLIPLGKDCPPVYCAGRKVLVKGENAGTELVLRKEYCELRLKISGYGRVFSDSMPGVCLVGNVSGIGTEGVIAGDFNCLARFSSAGVCNVRIPRQKDGSLTLYMTTSVETDIVKRFALGELIIAAGYDWRAENLEDLDVEIDFALLSLTFHTNDWKKTMDLKISI